MSIALHVTFYRAMIMLGIYFRLIRSELVLDISVKLGPEISSSELSCTVCSV